jgi:hypothetical protein
LYQEHQIKTINLNYSQRDELVVELILKAEELNEVVITNMPSIKISKMKSGNKKLDEYTLEKKMQELQSRWSLQALSKTE